MEQFIFSTKVLASPWSILPGGTLYSQMPNTNTDRYAGGLNFFDSFTELSLERYMLIFLIGSTFQTPTVSKKILD